MPSSIVHFVIPNTEPCLLFVLHFRRDLCTLFFFFASTCIWPTKTTDRERDELLQFPDLPDNLWQTIRVLSSIKMACESNVFSISTRCDATTDGLPVDYYN